MLTMEQLEMIRKITEAAEIATNDGTEEGVGLSHALHQASSFFNQEASTAGQTMAAMFAALSEACGVLMI